MIKNLGIIGSGKMGTDLFHYLSDFGFSLRWFILFEDEKEKLQASFDKKIARQLKHGAIGEREYALKAEFILTNDLNDLSDCDVVIECIVEELGQKLSLLERLSTIISKDCLVVSNSSSILPSMLSEYFPVLGMHFFYPVTFKNVVELVIPDQTNEKKSESARNFLELINKKVFLQDEKGAFLLNRFLLQLQIKAFELVNKYRISYLAFDKLAKPTIPDFGLFEMMGQVGLKTMYNSISNYANMEADTKKYKPFLLELEKNIRNNSEFLDDAHKEEPWEEIKNEILTDLKSAINNAFNEYRERYAVDETFFKDSINEFCGLQL